MKPGSVNWTRGEHLLDHHKVPDARRFGQHNPEAWLRFTRQVVAGIGFSCRGPVLCEAYEELQLRADAAQQ